MKIRIETQKESKFEEDTWNKKVVSRPEFAGPQEETKRGCEKNHLILFHK